MRPEEEVQLRKLIVLISLGLLMFLGYRIGEKVGDLLIPAQVSEKLEEGEKEKITIQKNRIKKLKRFGAVSIRADRYVPEEGTTTVTVKDDGEVVVKSKVIGLTIRPGVGSMFLEGSPVPVLDLKWCYAGRFGSTVGIGLTKKSLGNPYMAVSCQVYNNTAVFLGYSVKGNTVMGVRLSF